MAQTRSRPNENHQHQDDDEVITETQPCQDEDEQEDEHEETTSNKAEEEEPEDEKVDDPHAYKMIPIEEFEKLDDPHVLLSDKKVKALQAKMKKDFEDFMSPQGRIQSSRTRKLIKHWSHPWNAVEIRRKVLDIAPELERVKFNTNDPDHPLRTSMSLSIMKRFVSTYLDELREEPGFIYKAIFSHRKFLIIRVIIDMLQKHAFTQYTLFMKRENRALRKPFNRSPVKKKRTHQAIIPGFKGMYELHVDVKHATIAKTFNRALKNKF